MIRLVWFLGGVAFGCWLTALYYRHRITVVIAELAASREDLQRAVNDAQPKE